MADHTAGKRLLLDWVPPVVLAVAATHEQWYNYSPPWEWLTAEGLVLMLFLRRRAPVLVLAATLPLALKGWLQNVLLVALHGVHWWPIGGTRQ